MAGITMKATRREVTGKQVKAMRRAGLLPAVLYGHSYGSTPITLDLREASKILSTLGSSSIITIDLDGEILQALVRDRQRDYLKGVFLHIDFQIVSMTEKLRASVSVNVIGVSPAVKEHNAIVEQLINSIEVESLPGNLPEKFEIDVSGLIEIGDQILVKDLELPEGVTIALDPEETIVTVTAATAEIGEEAEAAEEETLDEPEIIEKGKREDEEEAGE